MNHVLKISQEDYTDLLSGIRQFELRKNDRNYHINDTINFTILETDGTLIPTDIIWKITYIINGGKYGLDKNYCIFSVEKIGTKDSLKTVLLKAYTYDNFTPGYCLACPFNTKNISETDNIEKLSMKCTIGYNSNSCPVELE